LFVSDFEQVKEAADAIRARLPEIPSIAIVLGSGLGGFADSLSGSVTMPYEELPHWPASQVIGHAGKLVVGKSGGTTIAALAGRCHLYEGHDPGRVVFAVRALGLLGVKTLILTNAAGGVNTGFAQGALMVIDDHINLTGQNPLVARLPTAPDVLPG
jgi:purine-nucleoside phosphorylase